MNKFLVCMIIICSSCFAQTPEDQPVSIGTTIHNSNMLEPFAVCSINFWMEWERPDGTIGSQSLTGVTGSITNVWWDYSFPAQAPNEPYVPGTLVNVVRLVRCDQTIPPLVICYDIVQ